MTELERIGKKCRLYRMSIDCGQKQVAIDTGYTIKNVSSFECGRNDNYRILLWYLEQGLAVEELLDNGI